MKQHTAEEIITILREAETITESVADFCRRKGNAKATLYRWRQKYGNLQIDEAKRLKALQAENAKMYSQCCNAPCSSTVSRNSCVRITTASSRLSPSNGGCMTSASALASLRPTIPSEMDS